MSVEAAVYTEQGAITGHRLMELAREKSLELRFLSLAGMPIEPGGPLEQPLYDQGYVLIGWPAKDAATTAAVDHALECRDKPAIDRLGMSDRLGWCEFACTKFNYAQHWKQYADEREEFEESVAAEDLQRMKRAKTRYFFRCGTRPKQCGWLLGKVSELLRDATDGYLGEG